jgi:hypothetical protein
MQWLVTIFNLILIISYDTYLMLITRLSVLLVSRAFCVNARRQLSQGLQQEAVAGIKAA